MEIRIQYLKGILLIPRMNDSKRSCGVEPVPVRGLSHPLEVVLEERVICGVSIHHSIRPNGSSMKDRAFWTDSLFNVLNNGNISVVVLFQELKVKSISDLPLQDGGELDKPLFDGNISFLLVVLDSLLDQLKDFVLVGLILLVADIKSDLVSVKIFVTIILNQFFQKSRSSLEKTQVKLALGDLVEIEVSRIVSVLKDDKEQLHDLGSEVLALQDILCDCVSVTQIVLHLISRHLNGFLYFV